MLDNGMSVWGFSSTQYVHATVKNVEWYLSEPENSMWKLLSKAMSPLHTSYRPELDVSP